MVTESGRPRDVESGWGTDFSVHAEGSVTCSHNHHGQTDAGVSGRTEQRTWRRAAVCVAAASAILCAWGLIAGSGEGFKPERRSFTLEEVAAHVQGQIQEHRKGGGQGYDVNSQLDHRQKSMLTGMFSNEFVAAEEAQHEEEDEEKQQLMTADKKEERAGLAHLKHDEAAKMVMAAKAAESQLSDYASIYGTAMDSPNPEPRPTDNSADEQATAARAASDQLSQYASIYDNFKSAARPQPKPALANAPVEKASRMEGLITQAESALKGEANKLAAYVDERGAHAVAAQELKDILDGSLFQVKSVQDELTRAQHAPSPPHAAAAARPTPALRSAQPSPHLLPPQAREPEPRAPASAAPVPAKTAPAKTADGFPSTASMMAKWKAWEAARHAGSSSAPAPVPPNPDHLTVTSTAGPLYGPWQTLNSAAPAPAPPAPAAPVAPAPAAPPVAFSAPAPENAGAAVAVAALAVSACEEVVQAHAGESVAMENACREQEGCRFDFGKQTCLSSSA